MHVICDDILLLPMGNYSFFYLEYFWGCVSDKASNIKPNAMSKQCETQTKVVISMK